MLSKELNERVFGGANSVGSTLRFDNADYRVIGVLDAWQPVPYFFDLNVGAIARPKGCSCRCRLASTASSARTAT